MTSDPPAPVGWEAFDITHPDHDWYFTQTGRCLAPDCAEHLLSGSGGSEQGGVTDDE